MKKVFIALLLLFLVVGLSFGQTTQNPTGLIYALGSGLVLNPSGALTSVGATVTQISFPPNTQSLTASMVIFDTPVAVPFTVPTNGVSGNGTSQLQFGTLPSASWTGTLYRVPGTTAGCTGTPVSIGTVAVATNGAQTWTVTQTAFSSGDCFQLLAPSTVDASAANPQLALVVVK